MMYPFVTSTVLLVIFYGNSVSSKPIGIKAIREMSKFNINAVKLECVLRVIQQQVACQDFVTILHKSNYGDQIIENLSANNCYTFFVRTPESQNWSLRTEAYIILVKNVTDFIEIIDKISKNFGWNAVARFFIVIHNFEYVQYLELFKVFAKLNMYHVYVIVSNMTDETFVYTYNPFDKKRCGRVDKDIIKIHPCKGFIHNELNETEIENQIRPCPIAVLIKENPPSVILETNKKIHGHGITSTGIEQYMFRNIAERENFKFHYSNLDFSINSHKFQSHECISSKAKRHLSKYPVGFSIGGYMLMKKISDCYDYVWGYCYTNLNIYTTVHEEERWRIFYREFGTATWTLIAICFCSVTIVSIIILKITIGKINKKYLGLIIWGYLNSCLDKKLIKIRKLRVIFITWIWFSFFIINFYNTALYTLITSQPRRGAIIEPEKIFSSPLKPCLSSAVRLMFLLNYNFSNPQLLEGDCLYPETALEFVSKNKNLFTIINEPTHYKSEFKHLDVNGHPKLERWPSGKGDISFAFAANRRCPLLKKFQRYASYHFESGLLSKHAEDLNHYFMLFRDFKPFTLADFKIPFALLFIGYFISFIVYVIETNQIHARNRRSIY